MTTDQKELPLEQQREIEDKFIAKCGDKWKKPSYYSWSDDKINVEQVICNDIVKASFTYNTKTGQITFAHYEINTIPEQDFDKFIANPEEYLVNLVNKVPHFIKDNQIIIDFAQDTIIKALKGK